MNISDPKELGSHAARAQNLALLGSFELDLPDGRMHCSAKMIELLGWSDAAEPHLAAFLDLVHPGDLGQIDAWIADLRAGRSDPVSCYIRIIRPKHDVRQVYLRAQLSSDPERPNEAFGIIQDLTEAMAERQVLAESMLLAQDMFRNATWGMFQTSKDGRYLNANAALARIYGYGSTREMREGLTNIGRQLYVDPGRRSEFIKLMKRDGRVSGFESQIYRRDGVKIWISESCREVRTSTGRFLYYEGTVDEITARKEAEEALVAAKETAQDQKLRFAAALENMSQGLCMFGADGRLVVHNPRFLEIYGFAPDAEVHGLTLSELLQASPLLAPDTQECRRLIAEQLAMVAGRSSDLLTQELPDGRIMTITHEPMSGGGFVDTVTDVTEQRLAAARIAHMALHDPLTDLPNRVMFRERLEQALHRVPRGEACAVLCLDLDQFKSVNDTLGHPVGDALLQAVTERLRRMVRPTDTVARLGGDEFAIVQSSVNHPQDATTLSVRLLRELSLPYEVEGHQVVIGTSIGIAVAPSDGLDPDQLLKSADMALYQAKGDGRGRYRYFEPEMDTEMQARRLMELDLRSALREEEFELYYQPLVDLRKDQITGFEALLRWNSPSRGMVPPGVFVPLAEEIGLIIPMGDWVIRQACREAASWPGNLKVAVNVSTAQFKGGDHLVTVVREALEASGLAPNRLEIEITESVMVDDVEGAIKLLHELKALGVGISMDDFGTGYSSLSYLSRFPFDKIKIDQSFVRDLGKRADCTAIIRAVTGLCDSLGVTANAEGVETEDQLDMLRAECCNEVQGYLVSRPLPAKDIANLLKTFAENGLPSRQNGEPPHSELKRRRSLSVI
jgi:diguanylate cyclase (GGDEF)-like protein/PAS domain S-box-containing protein